MLFDLRSKRRRRVVKITYSAIAAIFLVGFLFFGVGTGLFGNTNIFEASGSSNGAKSYAGQAEAAAKRVKREPNNPAAWQALLVAQLHEAAEPRYTNQTTGGFTAEGRRFLPKIERSWEGYMAATHDNPSLELAKRMVTILGEEGLDNAAQAVQALEVITAAEPNNFQPFVELAQYAYQAGNSREGDLASQRALALVPSAEKAHLEGLLKDLKKNNGHISSANSPGEGEAG